MILKIVAAYSWPGWPEKDLSKVLDGTFMEMQEEIPELQSKLEQVKQKDSKSLVN